VTHSYVYQVPGSWSLNWDYWSSLRAQRTISFGELFVSICNDNLGSRLTVSLSIILLYN